MFYNKKESIRHSMIGVKDMKKIGIIGGGQLGKMMILEAKKMDYMVVILDPTKHCPAHSIADEHIVASFDDEEAMLSLAQKVDVVTYEFEHISIQALQAIERNNTPVYPSSETLLHIQNKYDQKQWLTKHGLAVPKFVAVSTQEEIKQAAQQYGYPIVLKACTGGYDGKGNAVIHTEEQIQTAFASLGSGNIPLMVEQFIPFLKEVSVLVCQNVQGQVEVFPIAENIHKNSILDETLVPADITEEVRKKACLIAQKASNVFHAIGMLCIELFVTKEGDVFVNELAPRPHNSGHYTIEGCYTSQYENHIRAILGLPLGNTELIRPTVMKNIIGNQDGRANVKGLEEAYKNPNVQVHIYGKETVKVGRKMGHITATGITLQQARQEVQNAHQHIRFTEEN